MSATATTLSTSGHQRALPPKICRLSGGGGGGGDSDTPMYPPHAQSVPTASGRNNPRASLVFAYRTVYNSTRLAGV